MSSSLEPAPNAAPAPDAAPPARVPPVAGWKVAVVLIAVIAGACLVCTAFMVLYPFYMSSRG